MTFGEKFKKRRLEMGYSQEQFAIEFNKRYNYSFNKSTISNYENDLRTPEMPVIVKLAEMMNISLDYLLNEKKSSLDSLPKKTNISGQRLKELRKEKELTLRGLEEATSINYSNLCYMENGERDITGNNLIILASFFDVSTDYLLGLSDIKATHFNQINEINTFDNHFGTTLSSLRNSKHISSEELGSFLGVGKSTISMWENGKNFPTVAMLKRISEFFNVTTDYLLCKNKQNIDDTQLDQLIFEEIKKLSIKSKEKAFEYIKLLKISEFINLDLIKE